MSEIAVEDWKCAQKPGALRVGRAVARFECGCSFANANILLQYARGRLAYHLDGHGSGKLRDFTCSLQGIGEWCAEIAITTRAVRWGMDRKGTVLWLESSWVMCLGCGLLEKNFLIAYRVKNVISVTYQYVVYILIALLGWMEWEE